MTTLRLRLRLPTGLVVDQPVQSIVAEDLDGWFGIRAGRLDLVAVLPPGLLTFRDAEGESFVASSGGLLDLRDSECRVLVSEAVVSRHLEEIAADLERREADRSKRRDRRRDALEELAGEALRRLLEEVRA